MTKSEQKHWQRFVGKTVTHFEMVDTGEFNIPTFTFSDGTFAMLWADPEGNGPGWMGLYTSGAEII